MHATHPPQQKAAGRGPHCESCELVCGTHEIIKELKKGGKKNEIKEDGSSSRPGFD